MDQCPQANGLGTGDACFYSMGELLASYTYTAAGASYVAPSIATNAIYAATAGDTTIVLYVNARSPGGNGGRNRRTVESIGGRTLRRSADRPSTGRAPVATLPVADESCDTDAAATTARSTIQQAASTRTTTSI